MKSLLNFEWNFVESLEVGSSPKQVKNILLRSLVEFFFSL